MSGSTERNAAMAGGEHSERLDAILERIVSLEARMDAMNSRINALAATNEKLDELSKMIDELMAWGRRSAQVFRFSTKVLRWTAATATAIMVLYGFWTWFPWG